MMRKPVFQKDTCWRDAPVKDSQYLTCITWPFCSKEAEGVLLGSLGLQFLDHQPSVMLLGLPWELEFVCNSFL